MKNYKYVKKVAIVVFTILFVLGLGMFVSGTALSQEEKQVMADEAGLRELEKEYVSEIRTYLTNQGFKNSGVTLTWTMEEDGSRSYEVLLNHKGIRELDMRKQEALLLEIQELAFHIAGCNFHVKLLV